MTPGWQRSRRQPEYAPAADGIDDTAWGVFTDFVELASQHRVAKIREMQGRPKPPDWQVRLAEVYGINALRCATGAAIGKRPDKNDIHDLIVRIHPAIAQVADLSAEYVEDIVRQMWNFPPRATLETHSMLAVTGATVGVLVADPATRVDLAGLRACVSTEISPDEVKRLMAIAGVEL